MVPSTQQVLTKFKCKPVYNWVVIKVCGFMMVIFPQESSWRSWKQLFFGRLETPVTILPLASPRQRLGITTANCPNSAFCIPGNSDPCLIFSIFYQSDLVNIYVLLSRLRSSQGCGLYLNYFYSQHVVPLPIMQALNMSLFHWEFLSGRYQDFGFRLLALQNCLRSLYAHPSSRLCLGQWVSFLVALT